MRHNPSSRRQFLAQVGRGMLVAGVGYAAARDMGLTPAFADDAAADRLTFGSRERLVALMQETPADKLLPQVVDLIKGGTDLRELVGAAALANARAFGGEDYVGFHTFMSLHPAYRMALELPSERRALPVLKVLYRNAARLHESGHHDSDVLHPVSSEGDGNDPALAATLREAVHNTDVAAAERTLAAAASASPEIAWNDLLPTVHEAPEVHRIVLAHRAWDMLGLVGMDYAQAMLRQSLRYCVKGEGPRTKWYGGVTETLTRVMDTHKLAGRELGKREADDGWVDAFTQTLFRSTPEQAGDAVGAALAEGMSADSISEAISLAANQLVLRDAGRPASQAQPNKPVGSVHGDSIGVHASDSANAWRHIARASNPRNAAASLVLAGYQVALDRVQRGGQFDEWQPRPLAEHLEQVTATEPSKLLTELDGAIREQNQERACAIVGRYCGLGHSADSVFQLLLKYATSEDGALHAEKYFWTVSDEYDLTRPAFRNRQLVGLARVTASEYGTRAAGYEEACGLLRCEA